MKAASVQAIAQALQAANVRFIVMGGLAVIDIAYLEKLQNNPLP